MGAHRQNKIREKPEMVENWGWDQSDSKLIQFREKSLTELRT